MTNEFLIAKTIVHQPAIDAQKSKTQELYSLESCRLLGTVFILQWVILRIMEKSRTAKTDEGFRTMHHVAQIAHHPRLRWRRIQSAFRKLDPTCGSRWSQANSVPRYGPLGRNSVWASTAVPSVAACHAASCFLWRHSNNLAYTYIHDSEADDTAPVNLAGRHLRCESWLSAQ